MRFLKFESDPYRHGRLRPSAASAVVEIGFSEAEFLANNLPHSDEVTKAYLKLSEELLQENRAFLRAVEP